MSASIRQRAPSPTKGVEEKKALLKEADTKEATDGKQSVLIPMKLCVSTSQNQC